MLQLWRISQHDALDGAGAFYGGGRWNTLGHAVVYLAETPAGAMLEVLAHLPLTEMDMPDSYKLLRIEVATGTVMDHIEVAEAAWQADQRITQRLGDAWLGGDNAALVCVPSAIMPYTSNYLLNPAHPDAQQTRVVEASHHLYDPRLRRVRGN